jgi:hypothetical protein
MPQGAHIQQFHRAAKQPFVTRKILFALCRIIFGAHHDDPPCPVLVGGWRHQPLFQHVDRDRKMRHGVGARQFVLHEIVDDRRPFSAFGCGHVNVLEQLAAQHFFDTLFRQNSHQGDNDIQHREPGFSDGTERSSAG